MADMDPLGLFPNSKMAAAIRAGQSRFYSAEATGPPVTPANVTLPVISGTPQVGQTLTTSNGTWSGVPTSYTYQWKRGGVNIAGATANTYLLVSADLGTNITVTVTATNTAGSASATSNAVGPVVAANTAPSNSVLPVISGTLAVGSALSTTDGTWSGVPAPTFSYQWKSGATNVGTNTNTYTPVTGDIGAMISVVVTGTNVAGSASATATAVGPIAPAATLPANLTLPSISGTAQENQTLTTSNGTWSGSPAPTFSYQWQRGGVNIAGATTSNYVCTTADVGTMLRAIVTATNTAGSTNATATAVGPVTAAPFSAVQFGERGLGIYVNAFGTRAWGSDGVGIVEVNRSPPVVPDVPSIVLVSAINDNRPDFDIGIPTSTQVGDVFRLQADGGSGYNDYIVRTITSGDLSTGSITIAGVTPLPDGNYNYQARMERGLGISAYCTPVAGVIDTTAPVITTPTTATNNEGTLLAIALTANEAVTWTITGGVDQAQFDISGTNLRWLSNTVRSFSSPADSDHNNTYIVQVTATDTATNTANRIITVTVLQVVGGTRSLGAEGVGVIETTIGREWGGEGFGIVES